MIKFNFNRRSLAALFILTLLSASSSLLLAQTISSGDWSSPSTWNRGIVPNSSAKDVFVRHDVVLNSNISITSGTYYFGWTGTGESNTSVIDVADDFQSTLTMNNSSYRTNQNILDIRSGEVKFDGNATLKNANLTVRSGATLILGSLTITNTVRIYVESGATLIINGSVSNSNNSSTVLFCPGLCADQWRLSGLE